MVLNSSEKKLAKKQLKEEQKVLKALKSIYNKALQDVQKNIADLNSRSDMHNLQSIIYQKKYQEALETQIKTVLDNLNKNSYQTIEDYVKDSYINGYAGNMWLLQQQTGLTCVVPIDERKIVRAYTNDSKISTRYYSQNNPLKGRIAEDVDILKARIKSNVSRGIASGKTWTETAYDIASGMNSVFSKAMNDAMRIARTEGHRVNQQGFLDAGQEAINNGADIVKQWDATLDSATRPWHQEADGQIREWDEKFLVGGEEMDAPSVGGSAFNVCNCRCQLLQRAKWALDEDELQALEDRASFFGLDKTKDIDDFKDKYLQLPKNADKIPIEQYAGHPDSDLGKALGKTEYQNFMKTLDKNCSEPSVRKMWDMFEGGIKGDFKYSGHEHCDGLARIHVNVLKDAKGSDWQNPFQVICHESGHAIDRKVRDPFGWGYSATYKNGIFGDTIRDEIKDYISGIDKKMKAEYKAHKDDVDWLKKNGYWNIWTDSASKYSKARAYDAFEKEIRNIPRNERGDISDIIEGATNGRVKGGFGHGSSYWKDKENLALEAFAEMTDATLTNPKNLKHIKKYCPKAYKIYLEMVDEIMKRKI